MSRGERTRLMQFLAKIEKNRLTEFRTNQAMDLDAVQTLLSCQGLLKVLKLSLATSDNKYASCHLPNAPWLKASLLKLETLQVFVPGENTVHNMNEYLEGHQFIFRHSPKDQGPGGSEHPNPAVLDARDSYHADSIVHVWDHPNDGNTSIGSPRQLRQFNLELPGL
jgi:hypothetical protein